MKTTITLFLMLTLSSLCYSQNIDEITGSWINLIPQDETERMGFNEIKIISGNTFTVLHISISEKTMIALYRGTFKLEGDRYTEYIENAAPYLASQIGNQNIFLSTFEDGKWMLNGLNNPYNQTWKRYVPQATKPQEKTTIKSIEI